MQAWSLERKVQVTQTRIMEFVEHYGGCAYVTFSGGKDSTVLLDLARRAYPNIEAVFVDTGLEYPEIRKFVKTKENVTWLKPTMKFNEVVEKYGWNYPSKDIAMTVYYARKGSMWAINKFEGLEKDGTKKGDYKKRYIKFKYLVDSPFLISSKCCEIIKERPLDIYEKQSGKHPIMGILAGESKRREEAWLKKGCNMFGDKRARSMPLSFWTEQDILQYIKRFNIPYCTIYGDIITNSEISGQKHFNIDVGEALRCTGEQRTGCMFCPVGCHLDHPNKYERMKTTHPKQYEYCIKPKEQGGLGLGEFLDYINVKY